MKRIRLSKAARDYLLSETTYLRRHSVSAAQRFQQRFHDLRARLQEFPQMGFVREDFPKPGIFRIVMDAYVIDYRIDDGHIETLTIRHGRQAEIPLDEDLGR